MHNKKCIICSSSKKPNNKNYVENLSLFRIPKRGNLEVSNYFFSRIKTCKQLIFLGLVRAIKRSS
jgi:hypothetical protein